MSRRRLLTAAAGCTSLATYTCLGHAKEHDLVDVTVIGGGVVGLSVARELGCRGVSVRVIEKEDEVACCVSGGNSGLGCTGYDAGPGSLEMKLLRRSIMLHPNLYRAMGLSYEHVKKCGAVMVAWEGSDEVALEKCLEEMHAAGDTEAVKMSKEDLLEAEPLLTPEVCSAVDVGRENVVEPWVVTIAHANSAVLHGVEIVRNTTVTSVDASHGVLTTTNGVFPTKTIINCAGLHCDEMDTLAGWNPSDYHITPRKGEFAILHHPDPTTTLTKIIQSAPRKDVGKGVQIWQNLHGGFVVGPTAVEQTGDGAKHRWGNDPETVSRLVATARERVPALRDATLTGSYACLRPSIKGRSDYKITKHSDNYISVAGVRSTGLSASTGIGEYVANLYQGVEQPEDARVLPPYTPRPVSSVKVCSPAAPTLDEIAASYCRNADGTAELFGRTWKVGHGQTRVELDHKCRTASRV